MEEYDYGIEKKELGQVTHGEKKTGRFFFPATQK